MQCNYIFLKISQRATILSIMFNIFTIQNITKNKLENVLEFFY